MGDVPDGSTPAYPGARGWWPVANSDRFRFSTGSRWLAATATGEEISAMRAGASCLDGVDPHAPIYSPTTEGPATETEDSSAHRQALHRLWYLGVTAALLAVLAMLTHRWLWPVIVAFLAAAVWFTAWPSAAGRLRADAAERDRRLVAQGITSADGGAPQCPKCGATQFRMRRTPAQRGVVLASGLLGAAMTRQRVQCQTCGLFFDRVA